MTVNKKLRVFVRERAKYHCEYCKRPEKWVTLNFEVEHIMPQSKGGSDKEDNLACACRECNQNKSDRVTCLDAETAKEVRIFHPRQDNWSQHFHWSKNQSVIVGITAIGRATIDCLKMNNPGLIEARLVWQEIGWTPPQD